jgi:SAM-dependent methyltransferase
MTWYLWTCIILFSVLFAIKAAYVFSTVLVLGRTRGALFVSTSRVRINRFLDAVPMQAGQLFIDLGCGDGRVLRRARKRYNVQATGYELNPFAYLKARLLCFGRPGVRVRWQDIRRADLSQADVVFCYLFPDLLLEVTALFRARLKPGAVLVSCNFALPGYIPWKVLRPGGPLDNDPIYIYRQPAAD